MKSAKNNYHLKFKDKIVNAASNSEFIFNKTPILVPFLKSQQQEPKPLKRKPISAPEEQPKLHKKRKDSDQFEQDNHAHFNPLDTDLYSFFLASKLTCKNIEAVPQPKYLVGTYVLTAIADRGIGGKYLVTNFNRNKKGYIDYKQLDISHNPGAIEVYEHPGEFVMAQVVKGENETKTQLSLSDINKELDETTLREGQVIYGQIKSKQELSYEVKIKEKSSYRYLLPISKDESEEELKPSKQRMFFITEIDQKKKLCKVMLANQECNVNFHSVSAEEVAKLPLENYLRPGSKVNTMVLKVLKNGLIVKFLKVFYGYIFIDHLDKNIEEYSNGDKFQSRIIYLQLTSPVIYLSQKHADLTLYTPNKKLYSPIAPPKNIVDQSFGAYYWKDKQLMLHASKLNTEIDNVQKFWIKENNYFERYQLLAPSKAGLRVGEVSRTVPFNNFKVYGEISGKFRVMSLDNWNKVVKVSSDPLILSEADKQLKSIQQLDIKKQYVGFISTISSNGLIVEFQSNIKGLLNSHQIKLAGKTLEEYKKGEGILVYVVAPKSGLLKLRLSNEERVKEKKKDRKEKKDERKEIVLQELESEDEEDIYKNIRNMVGLPATGNQGEMEVEEGDEEVEEQEERGEEEQESEEVKIDNTLEHSSSHYHALLLANPSSFQANAKYITSMIVEKKSNHQIREQMRRSINSMSTIQDKQNIWILWINAETILGNLIPTIKQALAMGASFKIYERVLDILVEQNKTDVAIQFGKDMVKRDPTVKSWGKYIKTVYVINKKNLEQEGLQKKMKQELDRALLSLGAKQFTNLECNYARVLFLEGEAEEGRTIFQSLISKHPKRTDIWFVYIDTEIKYGEKQRVVNLFERGISLKLKSKKIQSFFKKYLKFKEDNGDDTTEVINKAKAYAASIIKAGADNEGDEQDQDQMDI